MGLGVLLASRGWRSGTLLIPYSAQKGLKCQWREAGRGGGAGGRGGD